MSRKKYVDAHVMISGLNRHYLHYITKPLYAVAKNAIPFLSREQQKTTLFLWRCTLMTSRRTVTVIAASLHYIILNSWVNLCNRNFGICLEYYLINTFIHFIIKSVTVMYIF